LLTKFWESVGSKLSDRWLAVGTPALVFWVGALLAWALGHGGLSALKKPTDSLQALSTTVQIVLLVAILVGVAASALVVERITPLVLKLLEGYYWPSKWAAPRARAHEATAMRQATLFQEFELAAAHPGVNGNELQRALLTSRMRRLPATQPYQATRVGNILAAAERRPSEKYGLSTTMVWSYLWLVMPDTARSVVDSARTSLNGAVAACCWGILFLPFGVWKWYAVPVGVVVAVSAVLVWVPDRATVYADLFEAAFDLYRKELYIQLRWPLPIHPNQERDQGRLLSLYLVRGLDSTQPEFVPPKP
jgi:hypothetical protein